MTLRRELVELSVVDAARAIRDREITSLALTQALLDRADAHPDLNAFITLDHDAALAAARLADESSGRSGPLHGVPLVVKDNIHVAGMPNTAGTPALRSFVLTEHAPVVQRIIDAGALIMGKANMHELAFGITSDNATFGPVRNPYAVGHAAGGSSGGTAVAIAARMAPAGLGTDTGGSLRIPAAHCGIVSFRPSTGRWPTRGITPLSHTRDTPGPMARTVEDLVRLDAVITGESNLPQPPVSTLRLAVPANLVDDVDPEVTARLQEFVDRALHVGAIVIRAPLDDLFSAGARAGAGVVATEARTELEMYLAAYARRVTYDDLVSSIASADVRALFEMHVGSASAEQYDAAVHVDRPRLMELYGAYFDEFGIDAILLPTTPLAAPSLADGLTSVVLNGRQVPTFETYIRFTDPGSNAGVPSVCLPSGVTSAGLPTGIELTGRRSGDRELLAAALALEPLSPRSADPYGNS